MTTPTPIDYLKYAAALLDHRTEWALDSIGGSTCDQGHETELNALHDAVAELYDIAHQWGGNPHTYSDGREIKTAAWIEDGAVHTTHVWHPVPELDTSATKSWRGALRSGSDDEGAPSPGVYEVSYDPFTQQIHVRVIRLVPAEAPEPW